VAARGAYRVARVIAAATRKKQSKKYETEYERNLIRREFLETGSLDKYRSNFLSCVVVIEISYIKAKKYA